MGTITDSLQLEGTSSVCQIFSNREVRLLTKTLPPSLNKAGGSSSIPGALWRLSAWISLRISASEGASKDTDHGLCVVLLGWSAVALGQLNYESKCQRPSCLSMLYICEPSCSQIVSLTPGLFVPVVRMRWKNLRVFPTAAAASISVARSDHQASRSFLRLA